jgi:hypothetical protein
MVGMSTDLISRIKKFIRLTKLAQAIQDSEADWQTKFELIFSDEISGQLIETKIEHPWTDPDHTEQTDVMAFVEAISKKAMELEKVLSSIQIATRDTEVYELR